MTRIAALSSAMNRPHIRRHGAREVRKQAARFAIAFYMIVAPAFGQAAQSNISLSDADREIVALALHTNALSATLLVDSTAPICAREAAMLCIRRDILTADVSSWDFPDAALLRERFLVRNEKPVNIGIVDAGFRRISRERIDTMFRAGRSGWRDLQRAHPGVRFLMQVSAPVYSSDGNSALIWVDSICDGRCGGGSLLLFERKSGRWTQSRGILNWMR